MCKLRITSGNNTLLDVMIRLNRLVEGGMHMAAQYDKAK